MMARDPIVVMTGEQLRAFVTEAVNAAVANVKAPDDHDIMNREQVAELIGVHFKTIPVMIKRDGLPTLRMVGSQWRFSRRAVLAWMETRKGHE